MSLIGRSRVAWNMVNIAKGGLIYFYVVILCCYIFMSHHQPRRICRNKSFSWNILCAINAGTVHRLYTWLWIVLIRTKWWYPHYSGVCHWHRGRYIKTAALVYHLSGIWMHLSTAFRNYDNVTITKPNKTRNFAVCIENAIFYIVSVSCSSHFRAV